MVVAVTIATMVLVYVFGQTALKHIHLITVGTRLLSIAAAAAAAVAASAAYGGR